MGSAGRRGDRGAVVLSDGEMPRSLEDYEIRAMSWRGVAGLLRGLGSKVAR